MEEYLQWRKYVEPVCDECNIKAFNTIIKQNISIQNRR